MKLTPVIAALRARCPYFENRVAGAAQFKNLPEVGKLRLPAAYVVPGDDSPGENKSQTDYYAACRPPAGFRFRSRWPLISNKPVKPAEAGFLFSIKTSGFDGRRKACRNLLRTSNRAANHHGMRAQFKAPGRQRRGFNVPFRHHRNIYSSQYIA